MKAASFLTVAATVLLAACSGQPTQGQIASALEAEISASNQQMSGMLGSNAHAQQVAARMRMSISDVKRLGCTADGTNAYRCDVQFTAAGGFNAQPATTTASFRFIRNGSDWIVTQ
jgi:hypothetical protein